MKFESIAFKDKFAKFSEHWSPKVIAEMNANTNTIKLFPTQRELKGL